MQNSFEDPGVYSPHQPPPRKSNALWWFLGGMALLIFLPCTGLISWILYIGFYGPETSVYTSNQIPNRYLRTAKEVGAVDEGENVLYFYSDAITDIRDGFYLVSDQKVATYVEDEDGARLVVIPFEDIADVQLFRNEAFLEDSLISITRQDGTPIAFPVSSEHDRDQAFFEAIQQRIPVVEEAAEAS